MGGISFPAATHEPLLSALRENNKIGWFLVVNETAGETTRLQERILGTEIPVQQDAMTPW